MSAEKYNFLGIWGYRASWDESGLHNISRVKWKLDMWQFEQFNMLSYIYYYAWSTLKVLRNKYISCLHSFTLQFPFLYKKVQYKNFRFKRIYKIYSKNEKLEEREGTHLCLEDQRETWLKCKRQCRKLVIWKREYSIKRSTETSQTRAGAG